MVCAGNNSELCVVQSIHPRVTTDHASSCGGPNRLTLYNYTGDDLPPPPVGGGGDGGAMAIATDLPSPWAYVGCFV
jgi:hypothetical protein